MIRADYDPVKIAKIYESCGARAISVLTDELFFGGSLDDLQAVASVVSIPVIRKDFIIDEIQINEARHFGASAILLIVRILSPDRLKSLLNYSESLGMEVLVETHSSKEVEVALSSGARIIGINTRDLDTLQIVPSIVEELASIIPQDKIKVGESGVKSKNDLDEMFKHVNSALIGSYFMKSQNIEKAFFELIRS
jgi:indole-3-glycerol phosphate synthase